MSMTLTAPNERARAPAAAGWDTEVFILRGDGRSELAEQRMDRVSMGQRQRIRLAMTFLHDPDVALLDEPQTSLDAHGLALLRGALDELRARGGAAVWCSPSRDGIDVDFDLARVIDGGRVVEA